jgi:hypothetical protein
MRITFAVLLFTFLFACNDSGNDESTTVATDSPKQNPPAEPAPVYDCYRSVLQRDTMVACLQVKGNEITGRLTFDNFEKDGSSGDVHGSLYKDTIKLWYDFNSEGMKSVMEVYFLQDGPKLFRGIGDVATKGDTAYFPNKDAIRYVTNHAFEKLECNSIDEKYRCKK